MEMVLPFSLRTFSIRFCQPCRDFNVDKPFKPFEQLMGVMPIARFVPICLQRVLKKKQQLFICLFDSKNLLPPLANLMVDKGSKMANFYPEYENVKVDYNGKKHKAGSCVIYGLSHSHEPLS